MDVGIRRGTGLTLDIVATFHSTLGKCSPREILQQCGSGIPGVGPDDICGTAGFIDGQLGTLGVRAEDVSLNENLDTDPAGKDEEKNGDDELHEEEAVFRCGVSMLHGNLLMD